MNSARLDAHTPVCAVCAKAKQPATITLTDHTIVEPSAEPERYWDQTGKHHHTHGYDALRFTCSNGHTWQADVFDLCPADGCSWAKHDHGPRLASLEQRAKERLTR
jgi:hypothetical protein